MTEKTKDELVYQANREKDYQDYRENLKEMGGVEAWGRYRVALSESWEHHVVALSYYLTD